MTARPKAPQLLIVPSTSEASGVATYVCAQVHALAQLQPAVAVEPGSALANELADVRLVDVGPGAGSMAAALRRSNPDVVNTHGPRALFAARLAGITRRRIHHVFHELPWRTGIRGGGEALLSVGVRRAANSPYLQARIGRTGLDVPQVLPPIVSATELTTRQQARNRLGVTEGADLLLGVVGRLHHSKAPRLAVEAVGRLRPDLRSRVRLAFVGEGPEREAVRRKGAEVDVAVDLVGSVPDAAGLLRAFDAVVVPSPNETFCLTLAEAAMAGVPVAAVRSPGSTWIAGASSALRLAAPNPADLARAVDEALSTGFDSDGLAKTVLERFGAPSAAAHVDYFVSALEGAG